MAGWQTKRLTWPAQNGVTEICVAINGTDVRLVSWFRPSDASDDWTPSQTYLVDMSLDNARDMIAFLQEHLPQPAEATR